MAEYKFDPFAFMNARAKGLPVTDDDKRNFQLFNVVQSVSMDPNMRRVAHELNELTFSHLPRDIQAITMQGLNRVHMNNRWCRAKTEALREKTEQIERIMKVTGLSHNDVVATMKYGKLLDIEKIEEKYIRIYEPAKLLEMYGGKKKRGSTKKEHAAKVGKQEDPVHV